MSFITARRCWSLFAVLTVMIVVAAHAHMVVVAVRTQPDCVASAVGSVRCPALTTEVSELPARLHHLQTLRPGSWRRRACQRTSNMPLMQTKWCTEPHVMPVNRPHRYAKPLLPLINQRLTAVRLHRGPIR